MKVSNLINAWVVLAIMTVVLFVFSTSALALPVTGTVARDDSSFSVVHFGSNPGGTGAALTGGGLISARG